MFCKAAFIVNVRDQPKTPYRGYKSNCTYELKGIFITLQSGLVEAEVTGAKGIGYNVILQEVGAGVVGVHGGCST